MSWCQRCWRKFKLKFFGDVWNYGKQENAFRHEVVSRPRNIKKVFVKRSQKHFSEVSCLVEHSQLKISSSCHSFIWPEHYIITKGSWHIACDLRIYFLFQSGWTALLCLSMNVESVWWNFEMPQWLPFPVKTLPGVSWAGATTARSTVEISETYLKSNSTVSVELGYQVKSSLWYTSILPEHFTAQTDSCTPSGWLQSDPLSSSLWMLSYR